MFRVPNEVLQTQLRYLRVSMVEVVEESAILFPVFDEDGETHGLLIDTAGRAPASDSRGVVTIPDGSLFFVREFPLEIRAGKAIYPRPITGVLQVDGRCLAEIAPLWYLDPWGRLATHERFRDEVPESASARNLADLRVDGEAFDDLCFTLDLRRVTGATTRRGFFRRRRLEIAVLRSVLGRANVPAAEKNPRGSP